MTIIGTTIFASGKRAFAWADTEYYKDDVPAGHTLKLCLNPLLNAVAVATGSLPLVQIVAERLHLAVELDRLVNDLQSTLKDTYFPAVKSARWLPDSGAAVALVAWSHRARRLIGFAFRSQDEFAAYPTNSFLSPDQSDSDLPQLSSPEELAGIATRQMATIRKKIPSAGAGMLMVADISAHSVTVRPTLDLASFSALREPLQFRAA